MLVAPLAGAWIEIVIGMDKEKFRNVAPLAGAWIEILYIVMNWSSGRVSLPLRERGLKYNQEIVLLRQHSVAPLAGAWIEISVWILVLKKVLSLPLRERGLK